MVKNLPAKAGVAGDAGLIPGSGRSPGAGHGPHSSFLAWRISQTAESGGLQSMGGPKAWDAAEQPGTHAGAGPRREQEASPRESKHSKEERHACEHALRQEETRPNRKSAE